MFARTSGKLNQVFRQEVVDPLEGYDADHPDSECGWSEDEVYQYMTEAFDKVLRLTEGVLRTVNVPVVLGTSLYALPDYVLNIRYARLTTLGRQLFPLSYTNQGLQIADDYGLRNMASDRIFTTQGNPNYYVLDLDPKQIRLAPIPQKADYLELRCACTLQTPIENGNFPLPLTQAVDLRLVLMWMKKLAYEKQDTDTRDNLSQKFEAQFNVAARDRSAEVRNRRTGVPVTMYRD